MGLFDIFSNDSAQSAADARKAGLQAGYNDLSGQYSQGRDALTTSSNAALQPLNTVFGQSQAGSNAYADATGVNGSDGAARARTAFTSQPGYTEGLNLTLDQNDRRNASRGMLTSGNTLADTAKLATDYASTKYGDYVSKLQPYLGQGTSAATGIAAVDTGLGTGLNTSFQKQGDAANASQTGQGNAQAAADLNNYNVSNNMWGALMQGGKLLAGAGGFA